MGAASLQHGCFASYRTHARQDRGARPRERRLSLRAQVGRVSRDRLPERGRRMQLEKLFKKMRCPLYLTPMTRDPKLAVDWLQRFEGAGLDGVIAKPAGASYEPGKRAMFKIKHVRSADCVVAGFRWHKSGKGVLGSLLLGLYDDEDTLQHVGVTSAFTMAMRKQLVKEFAPLRKNAIDNHPWRDWAGVEAESSRMPGGQS